MKKIIILFIILFSSIVYAEELDTKEVELINCNTSSTFWISDNNEYKIVKLIAYDSTNTTNDEYICNLIKNANTITIKNDIDLKDKYNRELVWMYLDGILLQETLVKDGIGQVANIYNNYKNINELCELQKEAIINKLNDWSNGTKELYCNSGIILDEKEEVIEEAKENNKVDNTYIYKLIIYIIFIGILILILVRNKKYEK